MAFGSVAGDSTTGTIEYRLARAARLTQYTRGEIPRHEVCDAHPELRRAAREIGDPTNDGCPVCDEHDLVHVSYVFGPRLPKHGRCITSQAELARLGQRRGNFSCYVVEVCPGCSWNHLVRTYPLGNS